MLHCVAYTLTRSRLLTQMAWTQKWLDGVTNSNGQGFRLEGFDGPPQSMKSIFDHADSERHGISKDKMERFLMQRQPAKEFLKFFLDLHDTSNSTYSGSPAPQAVLPEVNSGLAESLSVVETEELVLLNSPSTPPNLPEYFSALQCSALSSEQ